MTEQISKAKITKPSVSRIYKRERLFRLLDEDRKRPLVWVSGPAGSGKTTLISSYLDSRKLPSLWYLLDEGDSDPATFFFYLGIAATKIFTPIEKPFPLLTPEYIQGISIFAKRFFELLCGGLRKPFALVLDNYHDVPESSLFHDMIVNGLDMVPDGITVIIISSKEPPSPFARLRANNRMEFIGWDEIRCTSEESREIVSTFGENPLTDEAIEGMILKTQGWIAGLVLLMAGAKRTDIDQAALSRPAPEAILPRHIGDRITFPEMLAVAQGQLPLAALVAKEAKKLPIGKEALPSAIAFLGSSPSSSKLRTPSLTRG